MKAVLKSRLWIPLRAIDKEVLKEEYLSRTFDDRKCDKCEYRPDRFCDVCAECPAFLGELQMWKTVSGHVGLPTGDRAALKRVLTKPIEIVDKRAKPPMPVRLKFTSKLLPHQEGPVNQIVKAGYGILESPPRSGKTAMSIAAIIRLGYKALILAAQQDWLNQFMTEFEAHTDLKSVAKFTGRKIVVMTNDPKQMVGASVVLSTYQSFISVEGKKRLAEIAGMFGTVVIDEVHGIPADCYARVVASINARYKIGLTATVARKDSKESITYKIIGPVKAQAKVETLKPRVVFHFTPASTKYNYKVWAYAIRFLTKHKKRNLMIVDQAVKDIADGKHILIPVGSVLHARILVHNINKKAGAKVAEQFTAGNMNKKRREEILNDTRSGKIKCLVGTRQLLQVGINIPIADTLYEVTPISNVPKFTQETSRIRTSFPGKPQPLIRHFIEDFSISVGCLRTCFFQTYLKDKFDMSQKDKEKILALLSRKSQKHNANFEIV